ncbi:MAG: BrnA antitoxin family protein [Candidatus Omnitrophota bacterium]|nr:BrnA antitoxin family protein [Candidatus Aminicenantes bacterium]MDI6606386.1 BrnA antitoxin family protein [Candidatus Omnitrophota bacterium]
MKTKKTIPKFRSEEEEAKFWDRHSVTEFMHELKVVKNVGFPKPRKRLISMRVDEPLIESLKAVATSKGIGYLTLIRMWLKERLSKEYKPVHTHHS